MRYLSQLRQWLRRPSSTASAALLFLVVGLVVVVYGFFTTQTEYSWRNLVDQLYSNLGIELVSISLTVLVIEGLNNRRAERERREELISQLTSPEKIFVTEALRTLRQKRWLMDGSLRDTYLRDVNLSGAYLRYANLAGAHLRDADLSNVDLIQANLSGAFLWNANLSGAHLYQATLDAANLSYANLYGANLMGANLSNAELYQANLSGADLGNANLIGASLWEAIFDENTKLPDGNNWKGDTNTRRFTNIHHSDFWRSDNPKSPAYRGRGE